MITSTTFPSLDQRSLDFIQDPISDLEIKEAVFCMGPLKAPGPYGLQPIFFHSQWETIGGSVCELIRQIYENPDHVADLNETLVVLIPKVLNPESLKRFIPISVCNVVYKIITMVITTRLKRFMAHLVAPNQCSFVPGRQSTDNIVITQEVFHTMRYKKGKKGFLAIKVDLTKAYDRIRWEFLEEVLREVGFNDLFRKLIMKCVSRRL